MSKADRRLARFVKALIANRRPPRSPAGRRLRGDAGRHAPSGGASRWLDAVAGIRRQPRAPAARGGRPRARLDRGGDPPPPLPGRRARHGRRVGGGAVSVSSAFARCSPSRRAAAGPSSRTTAPGSRSRPSAEVTPGKIKQFSAGGIQGVVFTLDGEIRALSAVCTHQGCTLDPRGRAAAGSSARAIPMSFNLTGDGEPGRLSPEPAAGDPDACQRRQRRGARPPPGPEARPLATGDAARRRDGSDPAPGAVRTKR